MTVHADTSNGRYQAVTEHNVSRVPEWESIEPDLQQAIQVVSRVLPFRTNKYVMRDLIDWKNLPDDAMFQLVFPQKGMLGDEDYDAVQAMLAKNTSREELSQVVNRIRMGLNVSLNLM